MGSLWRKSIQRKTLRKISKANKKFDESLKENNVNSDTIVNSNVSKKNR